MGSAVSAYRSVFRTTEVQLKWCGAGGLQIPLDFRKQLEAEPAGLESFNLDQEYLVKFQECVPKQLLAEIHGKQIKRQACCRSESYSQFYLPRHDVASLHQA